MHRRQIVPEARIDRHEADRHADAMRVVSELKIGGLGGDDLAALARTQKSQRAQKLARTGAGHDVLGIGALVPGDRLLEIQNLGIGGVAAPFGDRARHRGARGRGGAVGILVPAQHQGRGVRGVRAGEPQRQRRASHEQRGRAEELAAVYGHNVLFRLSAAPAAERKPTPERAGEGMLCARCLRWTRAESGR